MALDYNLFEPSSNPTGVGGARPGAGRKPAGYEPPEEVKNFNVARARNEFAKAQLNELDLKVKSGEYVSRASVQQAAATTMALLVQNLRSVADHLERKGVPASVCAQVDAVISDSLAEVGRNLATIGGDV